MSVKSKTKKKKRTNDFKGFGVPTPYEIQKIRGFSKDGKIRNRYSKDAKRFYDKYLSLIDYGGGIPSEVNDVFIEVTGCLGDDFIFYLKDLETRTLIRSNEPTYEVDQDWWIVPIPGEKRFYNNTEKDNQIFQWIHMRYGRKLTEEFLDKPEVMDAVYALLDFTQTPWMKEVPEEGLPLPGEKVTRNGVTGNTVNYPTSENRNLFIAELAAAKQKLLEVLNP